MKQLWAPWRIAYLRKKAPSGCVFCQIKGSGFSESDYVLWQGEHCFVALNLYPYNSGHLLIIPTHHIGELDLLPTESFVQLCETLRRSVKILQEVLKCHGVNVGMNLGHAAGAGIPHHLHYHVVPRWDGDVNFMPVLAETRVIPQLLESTYQNLKPHFSKLMD